jgi:hypothetical protein
MLALPLSLAGENKREDTYTHTEANERARGRERHDEKAKRFFSVVNK